MRLIQKIEICCYTSSRNNRKKKYINLILDFWNISQFQIVFTIIYENLSSFFPATLISDLGDSNLSCRQDKCNKMTRLAIGQTKILLCSFREAWYHNFLSVKRNFSYTSDFH